jgi:two-component system heavy metal sensor histidine kinase CusS
MSIRTRLTLWYATALTGALTLFGGLIFFSLQQRLLSEADRELDGAAARFQSYFLSEAHSETWTHLPGELKEFCQGLPPATHIQIQGSDGFAFRFPQTAHAAGAYTKSVRRQFTFRGIAFDMQAETSIAETINTLRILRLLLLSLSPLVILAASVGGAWLSRRALKPVNDITSAALQIGIENLSQRLPVLSTGDEIARLSEVLNTMFARLEAAVNTLSQFVADASHELRTPLAVIRTTAELALRRERSPESYRESLEQVVAGAERMTQLVEDLLTLARNDARTAEMPLAPLDIREVLGNVCAEMAGIADVSQIEIQLEAGPVPQIIAANQTALHRLFVVLLDNAVKYSSPGGKVSVNVTKHDDCIRVSMQDTGRGIDEASLPHIFKRFYRADPARTGAGHGLGLSLAESIAGAHRAVIEVQSRQSVGSVFQVIFPAR